MDIFAHKYSEKIAESIIFRTSGPVELYLSPLLRYSSKGPLVRKIMLSAIFSEYLRIKISLWGLDTVDSKLSNEIS